MRTRLLAAGRLPLAARFPPYVLRRLGEKSARPALSKATGPAVRTARPSWSDEPVVGLDAGRGIHLLVGVRPDGPFPRLATGAGGGVPGGPLRVGHVRGRRRLTDDSSRCLSADRALLSPARGEEAARRHVDARGPGGGIVGKGRGRARRSACDRPAASGPWRQYRSRPAERTGSAAA